MQGLCSQCTDTYVLHGWGVLGCCMLHQGLFVVCRSTCMMDLRAAISRYASAFQMLFHWTMREGGAYLHISVRTSIISVDPQPRWNAASLESWLTDPGKPLATQDTQTRISMSMQQQRQQHLLSEWSKGRSAAMRCQLLFAACWATSRFRLAMVALPVSVFWRLASISAAELCI